jgi:hypothetical protein
MAISKEKAIHKINRLRDNPNGMGTLCQMHPLRRSPKTNPILQQMYSYITWGKVGNFGDLIERMTSPVQDRHF